MLVFCPHCSEKQSIFIIAQHMKTCKELREKTSSGDYVLCVFCRRPFERRVIRDHTKECRVGKSESEIWRPSPTPTSSKHTGYRCSAGHDFTGHLFICSHESKIYCAAHAHEGSCCRLDGQKVVEPASPTSPVEARCRCGQPPTHRCAVLRFLCDRHYHSVVGEGLPPASCCERIEEGEKSHSARVKDTRFHCCGIQPRFFCMTDNNARCYFHAHRLSSEIMSCCQPLSEFEGNHAEAHEAPAQPKESEGTETRSRDGLKYVSVPEENTEASKD